MTTGAAFQRGKKKFKFHSQEHVAIENTFGLLKQRFRRLYLVDAGSIKQCCLIIMAACVLHNMSNDEHDFFDELEQLPELEGVQNEEDSDLDFDCSTAKQCERVRKAIAQKQC